MSATQTALDSNHTLGAGRTGSRSYPKASRPSRPRMLRRATLVVALCLCIAPSLALHIAHAATALAWNTSITAGPAPLARPAVAVGQDGNVYVFGGTLGEGTVYSSTFIYQPNTNSWSMGAPMPVAREGAQAVTLPDGRIAVLGGGTQCQFNNLCSAGTVYNRVDVYSPSTNSWDTLAPMQSPRYRFAAVLYQGQIYAMGGSDGTQAVSSVEAYDPNTDSWTAVASLPQPIEAPAATVDSSNQIDLLGGFDGDSIDFNTMYTFNGTAWSSGPPLPEATEDAGATVGADGQVYLVGGFNQDWIDTVQVYDPSQGSWSYGTPLPTPTCCSGVVTVPGGQIYVIAGGVSAGAQVDVYGPTIALVPPAGAPGTTSIMTGTNFAPSATVSLYWGTAATGTLLGTGATDTNGNVAPISFTVPLSTAPGTYVLTAMDDQSSYPVTTTFVVPTSGPDLAALSTSSGGYQQSVRVTGTGFRSREPVVLYWDHFSSPLTATKSSASGRFIASITVPAATAGAHYILAYGLYSHRLSFRRFLVRPRTILAQSVSSAGSPNSVTAYGFTRGETISVYWQSTGTGGTLLGTAIANAQGSATVPFTTPSGTPGLYNVLSTGLAKGGISNLTLTP